MKSHLTRLLLILALVLALALVACGGDEAEVEEPTEDVAEETMDETEDEVAVEDTETEDVEGAPFTVGISNSFVDSEYRTQMISVLEEVNAEFMTTGLTEPLVIESETTDVAGQIQQIQNLMNRGVDAIIINPGDVEGLNLILEEAVEAGIVVIAIDQEICAEGVYNVAIDQKEWAMISAEWWAERLQEGDAVLIEGFVGHPANVARMEGVEEVLANYPDINIVGRESGMWDEATGQQVMSDFLASFPNLDGYWTQDGMAIGALQAVRAADPEEWPLGVGEGRVQYLKLWNEILQERPDFESIAVANPPGVAGSGLRIALELLQGAEVDESKLAGECNNSLYMPIPIVVTSENFEEVYNEYQDYPESHLLDGVLTQEQAQDLVIR